MYKAILLALSSLFFISCAHVSESEYYDIVTKKNKAMISLNKTKNDLKECQEHQEFRQHQYSLISAEIENIQVILKKNGISLDVDYIAVDEAGSLALIVGMLASKSHPGESIIVGMVWAKINGQWQQIHSFVLGSSQDKNTHQETI